MESSTRGIELLTVGTRIVEGVTCFAIREERSAAATRITDERSVTALPVLAVSLA